MATRLLKTHHVSKAVGAFMLRGVCVCVCVCVYVYVCVFKEVVP